jgi:hypothetical protein
MIALMALAICGASVAGYLVGRGAPRGVQLQSFSLTSGRNHWVTVSRPNCTVGTATFLGEAVCSWFGKIRVAP